MRSGIIAGGNWIVDHVKLIDTWPPQDALATILSQSWGNGGSPYNVLKNLARLGASFPSASAYATDPRDLCPETAAPRNLLINLRALGVRPLLERRAGRHPRERIFRALSLLLWEPTALFDPPTRAVLQRELQTDASSFSQFMRAYRALWSQVN